MTNGEDRSPKHVGKHVANDVLVRAMDDELSPSETVLVELHLSQCDECKQRYRQFHAASRRLEAWAFSIVPSAPPAGREVLARKLDIRQGELGVRVTGKVLRRFSWGMAIAATLALGIVFSPGRVRPAKSVPAAVSARPLNDTFEVNGEKFVALPYSNPDLPISTSHIVQMQVPVSSLTEAGLAFEPVSTQETAFDHSVLADVVVGMDGQPLGVHVLSME